MSDRVAYHLVPLAAWRSADPNAPFAEDSLASEGFVHLTHRIADLVEVANAFYREEPGPHVVLAVNLDALASPWRYDGDERYPHVYGPLDRGAILGVRAIERDVEGVFVLPERS